MTRSWGLSFVVMGVVGASQTGCLNPTSSAPGGQRMSLASSEGSLAAPTAPCPKRQAAVEEARATLASFIVALRTPNPRQQYFSVLVAVPAQDGTVQDVWIDGLSYDDGRIAGTVSGQVPKGVGLRRGQNLSVPAEDVRDWMIIEDGRMRGGFTVAVTKAITR